MDRNPNDSGKKKEGGNEVPSTPAPPPNSSRTLETFEQFVQLSNAFRNLSDKLYDKRKTAALEVEQKVRELNSANEDEKIKSLIEHLVTNFSSSNQGNQRKGGLIALAAVAIGLGSNTPKFLPLLIPPVLKCFLDQDNRIRYYACESLYNISKVARGAILFYFNEIFHSLSLVCFFFFLH